MSYEAVFALVLSTGITLFLLWLFWPWAYTWRQEKKAKAQLLKEAMQRPPVPPYPMDGEENDN